MAIPKHQPIKKKLLFAQEFLKDLNGTQAAIRAGYSPKTAYAQGNRLLKDAEVKMFLAEHTANYLEEAGIDARRWLQEVNTAAFLDPKDIFAADGTLLSIDQMPALSRRAIASFEVVETFEMQGEGKDRHRVWTGYIKRVKLVSKEGMLNLCARHLGLLHDKFDLAVKDERVDVLRGMQARRERARADRGNK